MGKNVFGLRHSSRAMTFTDSQLTDVRFEDVISKFAKVRDVPLRLRMRPHSIVHRRDDQNWCLSREQAGGEKVARLTASSSRHEVRRRRRNNDQLRGPGQAYVVERVACLDQFRVNGSTGQRFERDRTDELGRGFCENDVDFSRRLREESCQPRRFVAGYASRDSEKDATARKRPDGSYSSPRRRVTTRYSI